MSLTRACWCNLFEMETVAVPAIERIGPKFKK